MLFRRQIFLGFLSACFVFAFLGVPDASAKSETMQRALAIASAWEKWVKKSGAQSSAIAIALDGETLILKGQNRNATDPFPVGSLSKAITGVCIAKLVAAQKLAYDTPISKILPELALSATIGELLTHTSGLKVDVTQSSLVWVKDRSKENLELISLREIEKNSPNTADKSYHYNNVNYQILGWAISRITGQSYQAACNDLVLKPIGINNAILNPDWVMMAAFGGWMISADDYLRFINASFSNDGVLGVSPIDLPGSPFDWGGVYGLGTFYRAAKDGGFHYWHFGSWDWRGAPKPETFGAYFVRWNNGWSVSVNYDIAPDFETSILLDNSLSSVAFGRGK